jgi:hypothetical protein
MWDYITGIKTVLWKKITGEELSKMDQEPAISYIERNGIAYGTQDSLYKNNSVGCKIKVDYMNHFVCCFHFQTLVNWAVLQNKEIQQRTTPYGV